MIQAGENNLVWPGTGALGETWYAVALSRHRSCEGQSHRVAGDIEAACLVAAAAGDYSPYSLTGISGRGCQVLLLPGSQPVSAAGQDWPGMEERHLERHMASAA